jgi:hypothetical protein
MLQYEIKMWYRTGWRIGDVGVLDFWGAWFKCRPTCQLSWGSVRFSSLCTGKCQDSTGLQALIGNSEIPKSSEDRKFWPTALMMQECDVSVMSSLLPVTSVSAARWFFTVRRRKAALVIINSAEVESLRKLGHGVSVKRLTEEYGEITTTILPYYLSKILKILNSETHLAHRVSDKGLWTSITSRPLPFRSVFISHPVTRQWILWCTNSVIQQKHK